MTHKKVFKSPKEYVEKLFADATDYASDTSEDNRNNSLILLYEHFKGFGENLVKRNLIGVPKLNPSPAKIQRAFAGENIFQDRSQVWLKEYYTFIFNERRDTRSLAIICYDYQQEDPLFSVSIVIDENGEDELFLHTLTAGVEDTIQKMIFEIIKIYFDDNAFIHNN